MKRVLALLLASVLVFSLAACGGSGDKETEAPAASGDTTEAASEDATGGDSQVGQGDPENAELDFAWWGNQLRTDVTTAACAYYTEQHPGVTFNYMPFQWADYWTKLATDAAGDNLPDLIQQDYAYIVQFVESGDLLDLTPWIESGALDVSGIEDSILETGTVDGKVYALCAGVNAPSLIYDKTLTDSLGIEIKDNMTWEEFAEVSKQIYEASGVKTNYGYGNSENPLTYYIRSKGYTQFFDEDSLAYDDPTVMEEYYQRLIDGVEEGWLMDAATLSGLDTTSIEQNPLVYYSSNELRSWCSASFSNQVSAFQEAAQDGVELAITTWPSDDPAASNYLKPSQFFSITTDTENPDAAVAVLDALINDVEVNTLLQAERGIPASTPVADAIAPTLSETEQQVITYLNDVVTPSSSEIFPPLSNKTSEVINGPIEEIAEQVLFGQLTAADAAQQLFDRSNEILAQ